MTQEIINWSNPSVASFIKDVDPIEFIKKKARDCWQPAKWDTF